MSEGPHPPRPPLQPRSGRLGTESAFRVLARARELESAGREIIHLEIGQPDFPTAPHIQKAAVEAMEAGHTGYGPSSGLPELRAAIASAAGALRGIDIEPERVVVTPGGKPVIFYAIQSVAGTGDEVIYPDPSFPMYASLIAHAGATGVPLPLREEHNFRFDADEFRARLSDRTRLVILNSPQNPTGGVLTAADLELIAAEARRRSFWILSDEIYSRFLYEAHFVSLASLDGMAERTIILDGFSKAYSMTGWRLGYGIVPAALVEPFDLYNVNIISCPVTFNQHGALAALEGSQESVERMMAEFRRRRDTLVPALDRLEGFSCSLPQGAFYAFPNITETGLDDAELAHRLLEEAGVAVLPGGSFGAAGRGYLRFSYANSLEQIEKALERLEDWLGKRRSGA